MEDFLMASYYGISGIAVLIFCRFFLGNLFHSGKRSGSWVEKAVLLVAGLTGFGFSALSVVAGHIGGNWGIGIGLAVLGVVMFGVMMLGAMTMFRKLHLQ